LINRRSYKKEIALQNDVFWGIKIEAEGLDDTYHNYNLISDNYSGHADSTLSETVWLHKLDISLNGKHIDNYPLEERLKPVSIKETDIIPLSFSGFHGFEKIPELKTQNVIAIGESVHGSESVFNSAAQIIKYQVLNNNCKLVCLEMMAEKMFVVNRFIQGDKTVTPEFIRNYLLETCGSLNSLLSPSKLNELCLWLRDYNKTATEQVWLLGMDFEYISECRRKAMSCYFKTVNNSLKSADIEDIITLMSKTVREIQRNDFVNIRELWDKGKFQLSPFLGSQEFAMIERSMNEIINQEIPLDIKKVVFRDSIMAANFLYYQNLICNDNDKSLVYAHFLHTEYADLSYGIPMGQYLRQQFGANYFHIAVTVGSGEICSSFSISPDTLQTPVNNSIEDVLSRQKEDYCYLSANKIAGSYVKRRFSGLMPEKNQFPYGYISPADRMGGVIFIRNSKATDFPKLQ
jgi:erythromycin esterase-like protein